MNALARPDTRRARAFFLLWALMAGALQALSLLTPWRDEPAWWLQLASLALFAALLRRASSLAQAMVLGGAFALAWLAGSWWWLVISMHVYGGMTAPVAVAAMLALAAGLSVYYALAAGLAWRVAGAGTRKGQRFPLAFAAAWTLAELARGQWLTGFPWGAGGYAHVEGPLAVLAPWVGVYGIGFAAALVSAWLVSALTGGGSTRDGHSRGLAARAMPLVVFVAVLLAAWQVPAGDRPLADAAGGRLSVALLQGNIAQDEKFSPGSGVPLALSWYREQLLASGAQLVVAPETAVPLLPRDLPPGYLDGIAERFRTGQQALLLGLPLGDDRAGYTNSVLGLAPRADVYRYDKHHLVPFGEFIPPLFRWFTDLMQIPLGDFNRGALAQGALAWQGQRLAPNICYEDLFGEELAARFTDPARAPTVLVNLSNIAWFGDSVAIEQHLQISRMRALELRRPMLRATNTGATAVIDHEGRVTARLPRLTRGVLEGEVEGRAGRTAFARWAGAWGLAPMWVFCLGLLALVALGRRRPN